MAVHWGSKWCEVTHDTLDFCGIILLSKYPSSCGTIIQGKERCEIHFPQIDGFRYEVHDSKKEASNAVRLHLFHQAERLLPVFAEKEARMQLQNQRLEFEIKMHPRENPHARKVHIENNKIKMSDFYKASKQLKQILRRKVPELIEDDLKLMHHRVKEFEITPCLI